MWVCLNLNESILVGRWPPGRASSLASLAAHITGMLGNKHTWAKFLSHRLQWEQLLLWYYVSISISNMCTLTVNKTSNPVRSRLVQVISSNHRSVGEMKNLEIPGHMVFAPCLLVGICLLVNLLQFTAPCFAWVYMESLVTPGLGACRGRNNQHVVRLKQDSAERSTSLVSDGWRGTCCSL